MQIFLSVSERADIRLGKTNLRNKGIPSDHFLVERSET